MGKWRRKDGRDGGVTLAEARQKGDGDWYYREIGCGPGAHCSNAEFRAEFEPFPEPDGWVACSERMPEARGAFDVVDENGHRFATHYLPRFGRHTDDGIYDGDLDTDEAGESFWPQGFYFVSNESGDEWLISDPKFYRPLPAPPTPEGGKSE